MCSLTKRFSLTLPEMVSVVAAYELIPENPYYFYLAIRSILSSTKKQQRLPDVHRGYAMGYLVGSLMMHFLALKRNHVNGATDDDMQMPRSRFATYVDPSLPEGNEWRERCDEKIILILLINSIYPILKSKNRFRVYRDLLNRYQKHVPKMGDLKGNHSLAIMSALGILPGWIREHAEITATNKYMTWFAEKFPLPKPLNATELERLITTLCRALESEIGRPVTIRELENILCKVFRVTNDSTSDLRFRDMLIPEQNLFLFEWRKDGTTVTILSPDNQRTRVEGNGLILKWMVGDSHLTMQEMVEVLGITKDMPTGAALANLTISRLLWDGRWEGGDVMELNDDILYQSKRALTNAFKRISLQLRR
jgi:hypothetical protein